MTERELLRLHIEAVWNLTLPPLGEGMSELVLPPEALPPWSLYLGSFAQEEVAVWRSGLLPKQRVFYLENARKADVVWEQALGMHREVVFRAPQILPEQQALAQQHARLLVAEDAHLL